VTRRYETVYIVDSALEEAAINEKLERFHALLARDGAAPAVTLNHWGKRTLAYPINGRDTGYYVIAHFEAAPEVLPEYERAVKLDDAVVRFLVVVAEPEAPPPAVAAGVEESDGRTEDDDA
jgi:small subunit ribosomal protein S6